MVIKIEGAGLWYKTYCPHCGVKIMRKCKPQLLVEAERHIKNCKRITGKILWHNPLPEEMRKAMVGFFFLPAERRREILDFITGLHDELVEEGA